MKLKDHNKVISHYQKVYLRERDEEGTVNLFIVVPMIKRLLKKHSVEGLKRVIDLYFEDSWNARFNYNLHNILCKQSLEKYLPHIKLNPKIYTDAEEKNKLIY